MNIAAVVVPVYRDKPADEEKVSLNQCRKILGKYPIIIVCPNSLNISEYTFLTEKSERFEDKNFKSIKAYSRLCMDVNFYKRFEKYEYILIYQSDGWVFRDELEYWCKQGYDYIGAPWFEGFESADEDSKMISYIGNGGMSLRNVKKHIAIFNNPKYIHSYRDIALENKKKKLISNIINFPVNIYRYCSQYFVPTRYITKLNEDFYIAKYAKKIVSNFNFPTPEIASQFSMEAQPRKLYELNNKKLPFLCHAYKKYDFNFWEQFINLEVRND